MMASQKEQALAQESEIVLRDLDGLLRRKYGENLIVDSFTTTNLVSAGENYGSTMVKVDAVVRQNGENSKPEKLYLVAKMLPPTELQRTVFESSVTYPKETYMFTDIVPGYQALERECGIPENEVFDLVPELYNARLSLDGAKDTFDENAVILMENLKMKNYSCGDRINGLDLAHARSVVEALARFHTLSIAMKIKKPKLFEEYKNRSSFFTYGKDITTIIAQSILKNAKNVPSLLPYMPRIEKAISRPNAIFTNIEPVEPWISIIHTDLWVNNVMFRDDANGNPEDVKFIDFQSYAYHNPLRDLIFFLLTSCKKEVRTASFDDLVDLYYETFISHLTKLKCDTTLFPRKAFDKQFGDAANTEFLHIVLMVRPITMDQETDPARDKSTMDMFMLDPPDKYLEQLSEICLKYIEKNWI